MPNIVIGTHMRGAATQRLTGFRAENETYLSFPRIGGPRRHLQRCGVGQCACLFLCREKGQRRKNAAVVHTNATGMANAASTTQQIDAGSCDSAQLQVGPTLSEHV